MIKPIAAMPLRKRLSLTFWLVNLILCVALVAFALR